MNTRLIIPALAALLIGGCTTDGYRSDLIIERVVLGTPSSVTIGGVVETQCTLSPTANESLEPGYIPASPGFKAYVGFVVTNQLLDTKSLNPTLRDNSTTFNPDVAVVDYQIIGGATIAEQRIPTSSSSIIAGQSNAVGVPLFAPAAVVAALPGDGQVMTTTYIEGHLDDGSTVRTTKHNYLVDICSTCTPVACF
jgi:hypothetical protein